MIDSHELEHEILGLDKRIKRLVIENAPVGGGGGGGVGVETDPVFNAWLLATPPLYPGGWYDAVQNTIGLSGFNNDAGFITSFDDEKVKYDAGDPTAGYVADKIIAGTGISVAEGTGANENKLVVTSDITQYTDSDAIAAIQGDASWNASDWDTAYGWGNHAGLYLPAATVLPANEAGSANNFLTAYNSTTGAFSKAQPTWADIDKTTSDIADITTKSHTSLTDIGTNTHSDIDTFIGTTVPATYAPLVSPSFTTPTLGAATASSLGVGVTAPTFPGSGKLEVIVSSAAANTMLASLDLTRRTSGSPAAGLGTTMSFNVQDSAGNPQQVASFGGYASDVTAGSIDGCAVIRTRKNSGAFVNALVADQDQHITLEGVTSTGATGTGNFVFSASPTVTGTFTYSATADVYSQISSGAYVVTRTADTNPALQTYISAGGVREANPKYVVSISGKNSWGAGGASAVDTNLYRSAADTLKTDDALIVTGALSSASLAISESTTGISLTVTNTNASASGARGAGILLTENDGAALASGDRLGYLLMAGSSSASSVRNSAGLVAYASENWVNGSAYGTRLDFETTPNGSTTRSAAISIGGDQTATFAGSLIIPDANRVGFAGNKAHIQFDDEAVDTISMMYANIGVGTTTPAPFVAGSTCLDFTSTNNMEMIFDHTDAGVGSVLGDLNFARANTLLAQIRGAIDGANDAAYISITTKPTGGALTERMRITSKGNVTIGSAALATNATDGFLYIPSCAGKPTGTPAAYSGRVPLVFDTTNNKLYVYDGSWIDVT